MGAVLPASLWVRGGAWEVLSLVQRGTVRTVRGEASRSLPAVSGSRPSSWIPEGTLEVKVIGSWDRAGNQQV